MQLKQNELPKQVNIFFSPLREKLFPFLFAFVSLIDREFQLFMWCFCQLWPKPQQQIACCSRSRWSTTKRFDHKTRRRGIEAHSGLKPIKLVRKSMKKWKKNYKKVQVIIGNENPQILTEIEREVLVLINNSASDPNENLARLGEQTTQTESTNICFKCCWCRWWWNAGLLKLTIDWLGRVSPNWIAGFNTLKQLPEERRIRRRSRRSRSSRRSSRQQLPLAGGV